MQYSISDLSNKEALQTDSNSVKRNKYDVAEHMLTR